MKLNKKEILFFSGIFLLLFKGWLNASSLISGFESVENICILFSYIILFISMIIDRPSYKEVRNKFTSYYIGNRNIYGF